ncbi:probable glutamate receptor [Panulirus ornatus]|uniref:probable glutamate receptor n=1 Tax=Panulirus ornatus TaxID=150431 RepID=UPI003A8A562D
MPYDGAWGYRHDNGSWTGMVGMVNRGEADFAAQLFIVTTSRAEAVDFTGPVVIEYLKLMSGRGLPEVDPWGFLLPLTPLVWASTLVTLVVLPTVVVLLASWSSLKTVVVQDSWLQNTFVFIRVLLQQEIPELPYLHWERIMLALWLLTTVVLTKSYAGNLMSLLAVRHIPQPYQTLRDVVDDPSVTLILSADSAELQYMRSVESGIFREVADLEKEARMIFRKQSEFPDAMDTLVKQGDHVLIVVTIDLKMYMSRHFTQTGECYFYGSKEEFLPLIGSMITPKDSPLLPALNERIMNVMEAGLFYYWMRRDEPNSTICYNSPTKIAVETPLALSNIWGMFVVLMVGYALGLFVLCLEWLRRKIAGLFNI